MFEGVKFYEFFIHLIIQKVSLMLIFITEDENKKPLRANQYLIRYMMLSIR